MQVADIRGESVPLRDVSEFQPVRRLQSLVSSSASADSRRRRFEPPPKRGNGEFGARFRGDEQDGE